MSFVKIAHNAVNAKLIGANPVTEKYLMSLLSYLVADMGDTVRSTLYDNRTSMFPTGFIPLVKKKLIERGHTVRVIATACPEPLGPVNPVIDNYPENPDYDYQMQTIHRLVKHKQIIAQVATGGGKSRIARLAFARIRRPTLFLTTRGVLMHQMRESFEQEDGRRVGVLGDGEWSPRKGINVGMVQTFMARLKDPRYCDNPKKQAKIREKTIKLLEYFELVILEEAHEVADNGFFHVMSYCRNAHYRLALTGTPFMRNEEEANMRLMACAGPIGIKVTEKYLIDCGILAQPIFKYIPVITPSDLYRLLPWQPAYKKGIVDNVTRNEQIVKEVARATKNGLTAMILVQHKRHGTILNKMISVMTSAKSEFIYGAHEQKTRSSALKRLRDGDIQVLIGSTILDVGVDVPSVGMVALAGGGKAEIALRQRVGRGLRAKKNGPNVVFILDFTDAKNIHLRNHAKQRRAIIESTDGFKENILPDGKDFDYSIFGEVA